jgi:integrase
MVGLLVCAASEVRRALIEPGLWAALGRSHRPALQEILGHASITTTLDLYGHLYPGEMDRYADRLDDAATNDDAAKMRPDDDTDEDEK